MLNNNAENREKIKKSFGKMETEGKIRQDMKQIKVQRWEEGDGK